MNPERRNRRVAAVVAAIVIVAVLIIVLIPRDVSVTWEGEGTVTPDEGSIRFYETLDIAIAPEEGWHVGSVEIDGEPVEFEGDILRYSVSILDFSHHNVHVTFAEDSIPVEDTHTITITHTSGGTVDPSGTVTVMDGGSLTVTFDPDTGYRLSSLQLDGRRVASGVASYTISDITGDHILHAVFSRTSSPGGGGPDTPRLTGIEITKQPDNLTYSEGSQFDNSGMEVTAHYSDGSFRVLDESEYSWSPSGPLTTDDDTITVTHQGMTDTVAITVVDGDAFNVIVQSYSGTKVVNGTTVGFSEEPNCPLGEFSFDTQNIVPGITQTIVLRVTNGSPLNLDAHVFVENIVLTSGDDLAKQIILTATTGGQSETASVSNITEGSFLDLGRIDAGTTIEVTVTLEFPNLPENSDAMDQTISFSLGIFASEPTDTPTP